MSVSQEPLSIRNNNPGNLRFVGQPGATQGEGGFARFETPQAGLNAMRSQIELDTQTRGLTLDKFLNKYAPPSENKTANYIDFVARKTGLDPRSTVPAERIADVQRAMIEMEGGPRSLSYFAQNVAQTVPETRTTVPETRPTVQVASSSQLPASYRTALAATYLGDTETESVTDKAMKLLEEMQSEQEGGGAGTLRNKLVAALTPKESGEDAFALMQKAQEENEPKRRPVPRMPVRMADGGEVVSDQAIRDYLQANPTMTDRQIAAKMDEFGVTTAQMSRATGVNPDEINVRYAATRVNPNDVPEEVRQAFLSPRLTRDQYAQLSNYFGNQMTTAELSRPQDDPTVRDFVRKPRSGFEFASFLATRGPQHGGNNPYGMTLYENLMQPYLNNVITPASIDESGATITDPITGQGLSASSVGDNRYRVNYGPVFSGPSGSGENRTAVGLDYVIDPTTGQARLVAPYLNEYTPSRSRGIETLLGLAGTAAGMYFFPGMDFNNILARTAITAGTEGAKRMFADGGIVQRQDGSPPTGEVADIAEQMTVGTIPTEGQTPAGQVFRNIGRDVVRGAQYLPYDLLGAPVDIATMAMRPFGYNVEKPVGGSEYLIEKARQAGIAQQPTGSTAETATRIGMGFVNPVAVARQSARGIESLVDIAKAPIDRARIQAAASRTPGEEAYAPLRERLESQGILSLATRPGGSVMFGDETSRNLLKLHLNQKRLDEYTQGEMPKTGPAFNNSFLEYLPKIDKYMQSQFSTPNDPLLIATVEGRFKPKPFLRPNDLFSYDRKEISRITEIPLQDETKLTPAHVDKLLELSKAGNEKAQKIVFRGAGRTMNTSGQITVPQIVDKLKNTEFFDEVKDDLKRAIESTFWKELGKEEDMVPLMKKYISQKGVPNEQEKHAFNTLGFRVSTLLEAKADAEKKLQAKNPLFGDYPTSIRVVDLAETQKFNKAAENIPGMAEEISRGKPVYQYSTTWGSPFRTEDIFEYMLENDPAKWSKMSVPELIIASSAKDPASVTNPAKIARMADDGDPLTADQLRTGTQRYMPVNSATLGEGAEWREITTKEGLRIEGGVLQHCLKRETSGYCNRLLNKESKYFTLRDADGQPYVSIELAKPIGKEKEDVPYSVIKQVKGFRNTNAIPLYGEEVSDFLMDWQKKSGVKLNPTEDNDFLPQKFKQKTSFGIEAPPENFRKGGMVDKPLYDRAA